MKADIKTKWLEALRSGKYKQTVGKLRREDTTTKPNGYCCLGVLCDVVYPNEWRSTRVTDNEHFLHSMNGLSGGLSESLLREFEITDVQQSYLTDLNDTDKKDFRQIAHFIETFL